MLNFLLITPPAKPPRQKNIIDIVNVSDFGPWLLLRQFALNKYWTLLIAALLGVGLYLLCLYLLRVKELGEILTLLRKKLKKKSQSKQDFQ